MIITSEIVESIMGFNAIWVAVHLIYFGIYYGKYSGLFHKLTRLDGLEKAGFHEKEIIDFQRDRTWKRIQKLHRISFFPSLGIAVLHLTVFYFYWEWEIFSQYYSSAIYILIGALVFILLANKTQGSKVLRGDSDSDGSGFWT
ncbi:hypothetical protein [Fluviicola sp.]|uniref:hypothetical protein n=1 Tax=Fluviicola sp. TaxID=1917219 RepID=UPI003D2B5A0F